jgi:glycerophosphoryl diester phosphodiesterase
MVEWISHRGIRQGCRENTLKSFSLAEAAGFTWLETDLRCSADGVIVLSHDAELERVFASPGSVEQSDSRTLASVRSPEGDGLLFFDEFVQTFSAPNWVLDIKPESADAVVSALASDKYRGLISGRLERIRFLFWDGAVQKRLTDIFPQADCFARQSECWQAGLAALLHVPFLGGIKSGKTYAIPPELNGINLYTPALFSRFQSKGAKVLAYLPDRRDQADQAVQAGADYVLANEPLFLR